AGRCHCGTNSNGSKGRQNFPDPILVVYRPARLTRRPLSWCRADIYGRGSHLSGTSPDDHGRHARTGRRQIARTGPDMIDFRHTAIAFGITLLATAAVAQEHPGRPAGERNHPGQEQAGPGVLSLLPGDTVTEHSIDVPGGKLAYTATAGTFSLFDQSGERSAAIFYTAYVAKSTDPSRPLTFAFNGGPGAASAFLNLGLVGPRIAAFGNGFDGTHVHLVDSPDTWLAFTDPVATGSINTRSVKA